MEFLKNFIRFSRPHTVIGTTLSLLALFFMAVGYSGGIAWEWPVFAWAWLSCFGANIYIVGLNQLTDINIDRINKPYLPLASGAYSRRTGGIIISLAVVISLCIAAMIGGYLWWTVFLSLLLGTAYSLPPFRLKRFHFWAAFCIIAVRGLIVNLLLFLHFHQQLNGREDLPLEVWLLAGLIFVFSIVIAWFKDIPDMEGDGAFSIQTLSIKWGASRVFWAGLLILSAVILVTLLLLGINSTELNSLVLSIGQLVVLAALWMVSWVRGRSAAAFDRLDAWFPAYYQFIWLLFFGEYITFALSAL